MIPGLPAHHYEPCVFIGGPLDGKEDMIACLGECAPCDSKILPEGTYRLRFAPYPVPHYQKLGNKWALYFDGGTPQ